MEMVDSDRQVPKQRVSKEEAEIDKWLELYYQKVIHPEVLRLSEEIAKEGVFSLKTF